MKIQEIIHSLEQWAPLDFQESYDNSGLISGNPNLNAQECFVHWTAPRRW